MKILIVEDNETKYDDVKKCIETRFQDIEIEYSKCIFDAKIKLQRTRYSILILDMNLPLDDESECVDSAGYDLYFELTRSNLLNKPNDIIFLTAHSHLDQKYGKSIEKNLFSHLQYSISDNTWKEKLGEKIRYLKRSKDDESTLNDVSYKCDLAIIVAVDVEFNALSELLSYVENVEVSNDYTKYYKGKYETSDGFVQVYFAKQHQMGIAAASVLATKMISLFRPKILSMVGIAAGKRGKGNYGDILIPTEVYDYSSGKITRVGKVIKQTKFKPDPQYISLDLDIKERLPADFSAILECIKKKWTDKSPNTPLEAIKGPMASGPFVVEDKRIFSMIIEPSNRKIIGLDMETYGVFYATKNATAPSPKVFVCKSICDFADEHKGDDFQRYASFTSAAFLLEFYLRHLQ